MAAVSSVHLVDDLEAAFQNCLAAVTNQENFNLTDPEEVKTSVEQSIQKFLDVAKQLDSFFLQKRYILSIHRPEQIVKEDIQDLRNELIRKDALIFKHQEKIQQWQAMLNRAQGAGGPPGGAGLMMQGQASGAGAQQQPGGVQQPGVPQQQQQQQQPHPNTQGPQGGVIPTPGQVPQMGAMPPPASQNTYPGPLAYLEQTTSNIGLPERR